MNQSIDLGHHLARPSRAKAAASIILVSGGLLATPISVLAEAELAELDGKSAKSKKSSAENSVFELGAVTVSANHNFGALNSRDILTSVDVLHADKIENQNVQNAHELFRQLPGVQITQFNQGTTSGKLSFRGFNGEGNINAVKLLIDGIPSNTNDGNMPFLEGLFSQDIDSIEVVRGTNDARYGLHAIAGSANVLTQTGGNYAKGRVSYGSFDSSDVQAGAGYETGGLSQNYAIGYRNTTGFREHSDSDKKSFSGKWFFTPDSEKFRLGLSARWSEQIAQEPGYLSLSQSRTTPTASNGFNASDQGNRQLGQVSSHFDVTLSDALFWTTKGYINTYDDQRFVTFSANVSQQERITEEVQYGGITTLTYRPSIAWLDDFSVEGGLDVQQQDNKSARFLTRSQLRTSQTRDQVFDFQNYGGYLHAVIQPVHWLRITPGVRVDQIEGDFSNRLNNTSAQINNYGTIWQPKFGAVITPLEGYSLYGNWGRTFQVGVGASSYLIPPRVNDLSPSINEGWEVGVKLAPTAWLEGRIAYWQQQASGEVGRDLNNPNNDSINVGATDRQGADLQFKVKPTDVVDLWGSFSLQEAIIKVPGTAGVRVGNQVDHVPNYVFSGGIDYRVTPLFKASLWTTGQGDYFLEQTNTTGRFGEHALLNLTLDYQATKQIGVQFQAKNLTDTFWEYAWFDGTQTLHSPGDGIAFYGSATFKFDL
ncbi:MAG: TonB-dependent receptor [Methylococcaceae bacterium]|jgi:iron complex outermembrane receptor protein